MIAGPDWLSSDEEGFSDDPDYADFKERVKNLYKQENSNRPLSQEELKRNQFHKLSSAILSGTLETVIEQLDEGLDVNSVLHDGWTLLLLAVSFGSLSFTTEFLKRGANVNQAKDGSTALMYACNSYNAKNPDSERDILQILKLLVESGIDINARDRKRRTALMLAAYSGHLEGVKFLLPLSERDAVDNQRWTALFWAVDGNSAPLVEYLLNEGFDHSLKDIRGNTIFEHAQNQGLENVLNVLPQAPVNYACYFDNTNIDFEGHFKDLKNDETPLFFNDICKILYGVRSESSIPIWSNTDITLLNFLSMSDSELKEIGIQLPYQRNRILGGLYRLHKHPFGAHSLKATPKGEIISNIDISSTILTCIKQIIAMNASINYIRKNGNSNSLNHKDCLELRHITSRLKVSISKLKVASNCLMQRTELWDTALQPADLITKKRRNIQWANLVTSIGLLSIVVLLGFKLSK